MVCGETGERGRKRGVQSCKIVLMRVGVPVRACVDVGEGAG